MAKRNTPAAVVCPRCGLAAAKVIGRSESLPVIYLRCEECGRASVVPE
jgi:ribosomal protein L37E